MKDKNIIWIIGIAFVLLLFINNVSYQAIIGSPKLSYEYDWDIDATNEPFKVGTDTLLVRPVTFLGEMNREYDAPEPNPEIWNTSIKFQGRDTFFTYGETKPLNDYLEVRWTTDAEIEEPDEDHDDYYMDTDHSSFYDIEIYNDNFLESKIIEDSTIVAFNTDETVEVEIRNNLANNIPGGLVIYESHQKSNNIPTLRKVPMIFKKGVNTYKLDLDTKTLGQMTFQIRPWIEIMGKEFHDDRVSSEIYNVLPYISDIDTTVDCTDKDCPSGFHCEHMLYNEETYNICMRGELPQVKDYSYETEQKFDDLWFALVIVGLIALFIIVERKNWS